ncbi:FAD-dependent oxidoreductase [Thermodesulforhabdus norvegica]|uniref:2,4-dienoyl-CoA reductase (NADPH2) n=1 Tax=Thermodesulforhabdus norvegica TaxID=39841 RepID=A0A1I4VT57_9BACT|nr:FAD-dependent oxidoreductase [Thermodesulforhabdus norvegica]SFN04380.1 2,4-dienoyl-CoA reductase (NADPH2) [Thermodesulforhabdus norvegica]
MRDPLFEPISLGGLVVRNRIVMPAVHLNMADRGKVTDRICAFYAERAKGGAGLIIVGFATVNEYAGGPGNIGAHKDEFIPGLKKLAGAIRENGAAAAVQLNHAGRYNLSAFLGGKPPVAPSPIPSRLTKETPREMTIEEIKATVRDFAEAARRVREAGFDAVEILSGTGYLISEFLSPLTNRRNDEYGGSLENRMRFGIEVVRAVREAVGPDFPVLVRLNGNDMMPGGISREDLFTYASRLVEEGICALDINVGWHEARVPQIVSEVPRGAFAYLARTFRERLPVPVISGHRINDPATARQLIGNHLCDMVAMARSLIADPYLPEKARTGREHEIIHCVACAQGCFDNLFKMRSVECLCNPRAGHEMEETPPKASRRKKVLIAGGGAAGMSAAITAHDRGHEVMLFEKGDRLGGQLLLAGAPPGREEFLQLAEDLARQVTKRAIKVTLNTEVTPELVREISPDVLIVATGAEPLTPPIPGLDNPPESVQILQAWDVLSGRAWTGQKVVVVGGGAVGIETALYLADCGTLKGEALRFLLTHQADDPKLLLEYASRGTKEITLIEMLPEIGKDVGLSTRWCFLQDLQRHGVKVLTSTKAVAIRDGGIEVEQNGSRVVIPAETVVLATGARPFNPFKDMAESLEIPVYVIGDASKIGKAFDAIHSGYRVATEI